MTMVATRQRQPELRLRDARLAQRMMAISAVRDALEEDENTIDDLIRDGWIGWAWDIKTRAATRREVRVLARCVADVKPHLVHYTGWNPAPEELPGYSLGQVVGMLFGKERPFVTGKEFYRAFNCDSGHMINLVLEKSLARLPQTDWRRGPGGSPVIGWASLVRFIEERRIA